MSDNTCRKCYYTDPTDHVFAPCNLCGLDQDLDAATGCADFTEQPEAPEDAEETINSVMVKTWIEIYGTYEKAKEARQDPIHQRLQRVILDLTIKARVATEDEVANVRHMFEKGIECQIDWDMDLDCAIEEIQ